MSTTAAPTASPHQLLNRTTTTSAEGDRRDILLWGRQPKAPAPKKPAERNEPDVGYRVTFGLALILLSGVAAGAMYVSFSAQLEYVQVYKPGKVNENVAHVAALLWDVAAVVFALLGMVAGLGGRSALGARLGNLGCVAASVLMNVAQATQVNPSSLLLTDSGTDYGAILVWAGPAVLYAAASDLLIVEIQKRMMERRGKGAPLTMWSVLVPVARGVLGVLAWLVRLSVAPKSTKKGLADWIEQEFAYAPGRTAAGDQRDAARLEAGDAQAIAARVEQDSAAAVAAAEDRARAAEAAAAEHVQSAREQAAAEVTAARQEAQRQTDVHLAEIRRLRTELEAIRGEASGRQQVAWAYDELGRSGDSRYGREENLDELVEMIRPRTNLSKAETVRRYLREVMAEKGQKEGRVAGVNGSMIGGSL